MQIDIPAHIEKLLYLHEALVIPGFGGFTAMRTPASTDYVGGTVNPPAKTLAFSENLTVDDGLLTADIADAHGLSTEDALRSVEEFVEKMRDLLDLREIVTLPGVGRLYKNYVQKIQFLPDATNFNAASYGLPPLQFSPIARSREVEKTPEQTDTHQTPQTSLPAEALAKVGQTPTPPPVMPVPTYAAERSEGKSNIGTALGIFLLLAALTAGIWYWKHRQETAGKEKIAEDKTEKTDPPAEDKNTLRNIPPKEETPVAEDKPAAQAEDLDEAARESLAAKEKAAREKVNLARNGKECILIVASLSSNENADKLRKLLAEEQYEEYYQLVNGKTHMVGVRFFYLNPAEIEEKRKALMALTGVNFIAVKKK